MSSGAGGEVIGLVVVGAVAGTVVIAAGLVVGAGYCAVGVARGVAAAGRAANEAWEDHEQARALEARVLALESQRWAEYLATQEAFESACDSAGVDPSSLVPDPYPTPSSDVAAIQQAIALMSAATSRLNRELDARAAVAQSRALAAALAHQSTTSATSADATLRQAQESLDRASQARSTKREAAVAKAVAQAVAAQDDGLGRRISHALSELPDDADATTVAAVQQWMDRIGALSGDQLAQAASELETLCGGARSESALRAQRDELAGAVIAALAGCRTVRAEELIGQARAYQAGTEPWDPRLRDQAKAELDRIQAEFDDMWAAATLAQSLQDLGYQLGPDFVVDMLSGGAFAQRPDWADHAVHVSLDPDTDKVAIEVVRQGRAGEQPTSLALAEDVRVEEQFCTHLGPLLEGAREDGVMIRLDRRVEPGVRVLDRVNFQGRRYDDDAIDEDQDVMRGNSNG